MLDETGQVVKWFGSTTDINDKILHQETLQAARDDAERARGDAERADLAKSKFLAAASHDLRQPLQSLFLFADGLEQHIADREGSEKLLHLRRGLDVLKELLDALLDISQARRRSGGAHHRGFSAQPAVRSDRSGLWQGGRGEGAGVLHPRPRHGGAERPDTCWDEFWAT